MGKGSKKKKKIATATKTIQQTGKAHKEFIENELHRLLRTSFTYKQKRQLLSS